MSEVVEVYYDPKGFLAGHRGCWRARLAENHGLQHVGVTQEKAQEAFLGLAEMHGRAGEASSYEFRVVAVS